MKTLIDLRPGDFLYQVTNDANITMHEVKVISKYKIETYDRYFKFTELDHTCYALKTDFTRMSGYPLILYTNKLKALKDCAKVQIKLIDNAYQNTLNAIDKHAAAYDKLIEINSQISLEKN
jgi:hypothetical protein